jgi:hypothetical protein
VRGRRSTISRVSTSRPPSGLVLGVDDDPESLART